MYKYIVVILFIYSINTVASQYNRNLFHNVLQRQQLLKELDQLKTNISSTQFNPFQNITCVDLVRFFEGSKLIKLSNSTISCLKDACGQITQAEWISLIDATGKLPAGLTSDFSSKWTGNYEECVKNEHLKYCSQNGILLGGKLEKGTSQDVDVKNQPTSIGLCVPETCSAKNINEIVEKLVEKFGKVGNFTLIAYYPNPQMEQQFGSQTICHDNTTNFGTGAIVMLIICSIILILCFVGTFTEIIFEFIQKQQTKLYVYHDDDTYNLDDHDDVNVKKTDNNPVNVSMHSVEPSKGNKMVQFLICFSLIKNTKSIFDTTSPPGAIMAVNGLRVLSITWVLEGHIIGFAPQYVDNMSEIFSWLPRFTMQTILNATVSVDSFFLLSGLLVGYLSMKRFVSQGTLPLLRYYVHRFVRLTPSYMFVLFFYSYLFPILTDGPFWMGPENNIGTKQCEKYWWTNLIYINNLHPETIKDECMGWTWYLANDMQFYVVSPIILYCMYRFKWIGVIVVNGILLLANFLTNAFLIYYKDASPLFYNPKGPQPSLTDTNTPVSRYQLWIYVKPWTRMAPYLVGLVLGYILIMKKNYKGRYQYLFHGCGWLVAVCLGIAVIYGPYSVTNYEWKMPSFVFYGTFFRFVWAIAVAWVIYACHNGFGGLVGDFLGWKAFIPLSRLTYCVYLVHILVIVLFMSGQNTVPHITELNLVFWIVSCTVLSYACAYIVVVTIEYPVFNLEKLFFKF